MKHFLSVCGLMLMMLSGCAALPENAANQAENHAENAAVQAASEVAAAVQAASDVAAPSVQAASEIAQPNWAANIAAAVEAVDDVKVLPVQTPETADKNTVRHSKELNNKKNQNNQDKNDKKEKNDKADKNTSPTKLNVTLRNQPKVSDKKTASKSSSNKVLPQKGKVLKAPVVTLPPPKPAKPVLTRRQILEQEINRERAALKNAQSQLAAAKKSGNAKQIAKLNAAVRDRELNVKAIEAEMKR